jgi:hypothetical protein
MLDFPHVVVAQAVREFDLGEGVLEQFVFAGRRPWTGQLMFIENPEFHRLPPFVPVPVTLALDLSCVKVAPAGPLA